MKNQTYHMAMLFDFYGDLLTDHQRELFSLYYEEDMTLSEISELAGITRQGVRDIVTRAGNLLQKWEDKTGMVRRYEASRKAVEELQNALTELRGLNDRKYSDERITELLEQMDQAIRTLEE